jgi:hypothetical protein
VTSGLDEGVGGDDRVNDFNYGNNGIANVLHLDGDV